MRAFPQAVVAAFAAVLAIVACRRTTPKTTGAPATVSSRHSANEQPSRAVELDLAEQHRDSRLITPSDLADRNVLVRRLAARALARIADPRAATLLTTALSDEDPEVTALSAFGLGRACAGHVDPTVRALVLRAATLSSAPSPSEKRLDALDPTTAIANALAACGDLEAERTLRGWLTGERAEAAALALGRFGAMHGRLEEASIVALLDAASADRPVTNALYAFTRLGGLAEPVRTRLLEVAKDDLSAQQPMRGLAIRALEHAGDDAIGVLASVAASADYTPSERADAVRALGRMGDRGQVALSKSLSLLFGPADKVTPDQLRALVSGPSWAPAIASLGSLSSPARTARSLLDRLAAAAIPSNAEPSVARRIVQVRCRAASLVAGSASLSRVLVDCDPDPKGRTGMLAILDVLGRGPIAKSRYLRWLEFTNAADPVVRQAALDLIESHPEIPAPSPVLTSALRASPPGTVARAAEILATHPDRASADALDHHHASEPPGSGPALRPDSKLVDALLHALNTAPPDAIETRGALMKAAGALGLLNVKSLLETTCKDANGSLRQHAADALAALGDHDRHCSDFTPAARIPDEARTLLVTPVRLIFHTDAGELSMTLDPARAPVAVARIARLARDGFYDGMAVHRYIPGFLVQFGDPDGDGYADGTSTPVASEVSPSAFEQWAVGLALGGPDTGSTQLFVTLGRWPHLDDNYPLIGQADAAWARLALGDVIHKVEISP